MDAFGPFMIDLAVSLELLNEWKCSEREMAPTGEYLF